MSRRMLVAGVSGLLGLALTGCGAGQTAITAQDQSSAPGVGVTVGEIAIRNVTVEYSLDGYPAGGEAPVRLSMVNQSVEPVQLIQVSSPAAASVTITQAVPAGQEGAEPPDGAGQPGEAVIELPSGTMIAVTLQASGLREALSGAGSLPLQLTFDTGAAVDLEAPVAPPGEPLPPVEPLDVGHH